MWSIVIRSAARERNKCVRCMLRFANNIFGNHSDYACSNTLQRVTTMQFVLRQFVLWNAVQYNLFL